MERLENGEIMTGNAGDRISSFPKGGQGDARAASPHLARPCRWRVLPARSWTFSVPPALRLQRTAGNQAVGRLLATPRPLLKAQLRITESTK